MNPADAREIDAEEGSFFQSSPPAPFKPSALGHLPLHWYSHIMHALEIIGYLHPELEVREQAFKLYKSLVSSLHLNVETPTEQWDRLTEDRIENGTVVS